MFVIITGYPPTPNEFSKLYEKSIETGINFVFLNFFDFHEMYMLLNYKIVKLFNLIIIYRENAEITNKTKKRER